MAKKTMQQQLEHVIKLNKELTEENSRLIERIETEDKISTALTNALVITRNELSIIKSKWWYKLMTWGW